MNPGQDDATKRYPYEPLEDSGDYDEALDELNASRKDGLPHIPTFAQRMLERLREVGLLHRTDTDPPINARKVKLDKGQELWIRFDAHRDDEGYMAVEVMDTPRSDTAILAAMIAWTARPIDFERLLEARRFVNSRDMRAQEERIEAIMERMKDEDLTWEEHVAVFKDITDLLTKREPLKHLQYLLPLIQYYKPEVVNCSPQELQDLLEKTCNYINDFLESLRKLQAFLEYGSPNRKLAPAMREPKRDVRAAILHDVNGLNYRQIGEQMKIPLPPDFEIKGEHQTVRKMVERGRHILEEAFSEEGWQKRIEVMKSEKAWWQSLSEEERYTEWEVERTALDFDIPIEEARRWVERERS